MVSDVERAKGDLVEDLTADEAEAITVEIRAVLSDCYKLGDRLTELTPVCELYVPPSGHDPGCTDQASQF